jgi:hypothetical protein
MPQMLRVFANPGHTKDHLGRDACAIPCDPVEHVTVGRRWVGARPIVKETGGATVKVKGQVATLSYPTSEVTWEFSKEAIELPKTNYYLEQLRNRTLLPADAETADAAGIKFATPQEKTQ